MSPHRGLTGTAGPTAATGTARSRSSRPAKAPALGEEHVEALGPALDFMRLLWATDHGLQRRSKRMEVELGVTGMQRVVIRLIGRFPTVTAGRLAELLHVHPSTLTGVLKRLVDRGFVHRERDAADARIAHFTLTGEGGKIDGTQAGTIEAAVRRALSRLEPDQIETARVVLSALADELSRADR